MRLFPVVKPHMTRVEKNNKPAVKLLFSATTVIASLLFSTEGFAQSYVSSVPALSPAVPQQAYAPSYGTVGQATAARTATNTGGSSGSSTGSTQQPSQQSMSSMQRSSSGSSAGGASSTSALGGTADAENPSYQADLLATQAQQQRAQDASLGQVSDPENPDGAQSAPPDVQALQAVNQYQASMGNTNALSDDPVSKEVGLDIRKQAQKEAALSYGARGGLAKRNYQIMERMKGFETVLDRVFDFRALLIKAPSGLLIEPPIIKESRDAVVVTDAGDEAAVADKVFDINKKAKIVTAPRDWRQYLVQTWAQVPPPPRVLWPKNAKEQAEWDTWVSTGWKAGTEQADQIFEANVNQLTADYNGMVRYKMLLAQDMISAPFTMHEDRGVTGNNGQMRVGDSAIKITGPSQFMTRADLWKPADQ
jgi:defect-in-organelle-trafficking protein DotC